MGYRILAEGPDEQVVNRHLMCGSDKVAQNASMADAIIPRAGPEYIRIV